MICRVCDSKDLEQVLDLGRQPWGNHFLRPEEVGHEPYYPLRLIHCQGCGTAQLDYTVRKEVMFGDHTYLAGVTRSLGEHFAHIAGEVHRRVRTPGRRPAVLDIGSNDGSQLAQFRARGFDVLGVESSATTARIAAAAGVPTLHAFFNRRVAHTLDRQFDVVNASGVFFHLEELHDVTDGIRDVLADDGLFVIQSLYMKRIVENLAFDQIYHEHLLYYNLANLETLLRRHGLELHDAYLAPIHGGSLIAFAAHQGRRRPTPRLEHLRDAEEQARSNHVDTYRRFARRVARMKERDLDWLDLQRRRGRQVFGLGAPVKGNTLLNYFGIGRQYLDCLVEKNPLRKGLFSPGMHLPVVMEDELEDDPHAYYVLAWNFRKEILSNHRRQLECGVEYYFPVDTHAA